MVSKLLVICISIGSLVSIVYWLIWLIHDGKSFRDAVKGEVEDAVGVLQGTILIGCLIGCFVGILFGLRESMKK
jgi:hypothetical protein